MVCIPPSAWADVNGIPRPLSAEVTIPADEFVEVRMVFGAEEDERFDWTRFDVLPPACTFTTSNSTMTLDADCGTDTTIKVPNGFTLDGNGTRSRPSTPPGPRSSARSSRTPAAR